MLTSRYDEAFIYAHHLHRRQMRKETDIPYISHLMAVSALVIEHQGNEDEAIEAILFDYRAIGDALWRRFNGGRDGTRWYYAALSGVFDRELPGPLAERLAHAVGEFSK